MTSESGMTLDYQSQGRNGNVRLTARFPDGTSHTDKIDVADASHRDRFIRAVIKGHKGLDRKALAAELDKIAAGIVAKPDDGESAKEGKRSPSQADMLVKLAKDVELFHTPGGHDAEGYASIIIDGHKETWPINSKGFKRWLARQFYEHCEKAPGSQAVQDALSVIAGRALYDGPEIDAAVRIAESEGAIWLDLADKDWRAVRISSDGWQVVTECPVRFIRKHGMLALPAPARGGDINELRRLVNLPDDDAWRLYIAWIVAAFRPGRPFPILALNGEQGSAKSTACKMARALIDPNKSPLRRPPKEDRDLLIAATNSWVVGFDNLSWLPPWLSDALCMLATGGGFATRELYTDSDEKLFDATRPVILNGIEDVATRSDLLDRALTITLPVLPDHERRDEDELWARFHEAQPRILGAILDAVCTALRNRPEIKLAEKPRMADFACWIVAAEPALGWPSGAFLAAYNHNRGSANSLALESSIIGPCIVAMMDTMESWQGIAKELLAELEAHFTDEKTHKRKDWPTSARKLAGDLKRLAPNLRRAGVDIAFGKHARTGTPITIERIGKTPSHSSPSAGERGDERDEGDDSFLPESSSLHSQDEVIEWMA